MVIEPVIELRREPRPDSPSVRTAHAGDILDELSADTFDETYSLAWQQVVIGPDLLFGIQSADTLWAPSSALISRRDVGSERLQTDLSLFEAEAGVLGKRIGATEFLEDPSKVSGSTWVSATYGLSAPEQLFSTMTDLRQPHRYSHQGAEAERLNRRYDSLYARPHSRAIAHLEFGERVTEVRLRIYLTRRFRVRGTGRSPFEVECVPVADTTVTVNGYDCEITKLIPQEVLWNPKRRALWSQSLLFLAEPRTKEYLLPRIVQKMLICWPTPE